MSSAVLVTRSDYNPAALRGLASKSKDAAQVRRLLAIAAVLDGVPRRQAAEQNGMDRQTLRDWVHRYNDAGVDGLKSRSAPGREPALSAAQKAELRELVIAGPNPEKHGVVRWRCLDLQAEVARRFNVEVHESTIGKWLQQLGLTRLQPRPVHPQKDPDAEVCFKKLPGPCWPDDRRHSRGQASGNLVSRRSQGRPERRSCLCMGPHRLPPAHGPR